MRRLITILDLFEENGFYPHIITEGEQIRLEVHKYQENKKIATYQEACVVVDEEGAVMYWKDCDWDENAIKNILMLISDNK